jgi:NADH dehydrogenase FAD-containing subunit
MRIVIIGGGIAAVYLANRIKKVASDVDVLIVSEETFSPYDISMQPISFNIWLEHATIAIGLIVVMEVDKWLMLRKRKSIL